MAGIPNLDDCKPGIKPVGFNAIIAMEPIQTKTPGGIELPPEVVDKKRIVQVRGRLVGISPVAFDFATFPPGSKPEVGDAVTIAKLAGVLMEGADGKEYRICLDKDITGIIEEAA